ncbi:MAG TPA: M14 family zinc carboxypeptidase [Pyrinomonadaceae bacterium]|nr:M14 family zinc carboxypeptidase [Pyrinomonadaceae bacterium]
MYRTIAQLDRAIDELVRTQPTLCTRLALNNSVEGRPIAALRLRAGGGTDRRGILMVGGMHARELMNPDAIIELAFDLVQAYTTNTGLAYGGAQWSANDVKVMMETLDIWMLPCANPDGRNYVMKPTGQWDWRMNRRDNPNTTCDGVDVNRNCNFMWRVIGPTTTCDPCSPLQTFAGSLPFSEPESNNIQLLCDTQRVDLFVDVHSFSEFVILPWGHAPTQTTQPLPNFTDLAMGTCQSLQPASHQEFMPSADQSQYQTYANRVVNAISAVRGRNYVVKTGYQLYNGTTSGTSLDYVYSRHIANPALRKTFGLLFETGPSILNDARQSFQPDDPEPIKNDTKAGLVALMHEDVCALTFLGETLQGGTVESIRVARDELLVPTEEGRAWVDLVSNVQSELLGTVLSDEALTKRALSLLPRVQELAAEKDKATVTADDVRDGVEFLESLRSAATRSEVGDAISVVIEHLTKAEGQTVEAILKELTQFNPPKTK